MLLAPGQTTGVARLSEPIKNCHIWIPTEDKGSWTEVKATLPEGTWINFNYK